MLFTEVYSMTTAKKTTAAFFRDLKDKHKGVAPPTHPKTLPLHKDTLCYMPGKTKARPHCRTRKVVIQVQSPVKDIEKPTRKQTYQ